MIVITRQFKRLTFPSAGRLVLSAVALFLSFGFPLNLFAQGWQDYADQIRRENQQKNPASTESLIPEPTFSLTNVSDELAPDETDIISDHSIQANHPTNHVPLTRPTPESSDPSLISDASLFGLTCSPSGKLWAVGDRGAVWMSPDNGEKWFLVRVPTTANLKAVSFADADNGLIVGGILIPGTENGRGIVLRTEDGGRHWSQTDTTGIPFLYDVTFSEEGIAEAWGDSSELYPSGCFLSEDGGKTWDSHLKTGRHPGWKKGNPGQNLFSGLNRSGKPFRIDAHGCDEIDAFQGDFRFSDFVICGNTVLFSGDCGGLFLWDGNASPRQIPLPAASDDFNFETISFDGHRIDLAGNPGTKIFSTGDFGRSWTSHETGITLPIRKILFTDTQNGCAVGDFGNILVTHDGGTTWSVKHEGGRRAAWLGFFESADLIPYHWISSLALKEGFLGVADLLTPQEEHSIDEVSPDERLREAFVTAGGSSFFVENDFPVPAPELKLPLERKIASWKRRDNETPEIALKRHVVQMIRTWRPTLLILSEKNDPPAFLTPPVRSLAYAEPDVQNGIRQVTGYSSGSVDPVKLALMVEQHWSVSNDNLPMRDLLSPLSQMIRDAILEGVTDAADPEMFPEQIDELGLPPWQVSRIGVVTDRSASLTVKMADYLPTLARSVDETAILAQSLASPQGTFSSFRGFEFVPIGEAEPTASAIPLVSPFTGFDFPRGSEARRQMAIQPISEKDALPIIRERRRLLAIADHLTVSSDRRADIFRGSIDSALQGVDPETAAEVLLRLGKNLASVGDPDSSAEYLERLISEYPETTSARAGAVRLLRSYAGLERIPRIAVGRATVNRSQTISLMKESEETERPLPIIVDHAADAVRVGEIIRENYPEIYMTPEVRFPLAAAQRRGGELQSAMRYYFNRSSLFTENDFIAQHAAGEYALLNSSRENSDIPLSVGSCYPTSSVPFLDGILETEVWNSAETLHLTGNAGLPETFVSFLSGDEYLFIGIVAHQSSTSTSCEADQRVRDTDLSDFDRVEIALDPDRDFIDSYRLTFDCRGWVNDVCQNDKNWNPQLYIARKITKFGWILEIAVPWRELCDAPPASGNVWGIALRRIIPGIGLSSWNAAEKTRLEDTFGYLRFR